MVAAVDRRRPGATPARCTVGSSRSSTPIMTITQGAIMAKAALEELGVIESAAVRLPLVESPPDQVALLRAGLDASGPT